MPKVLYISYDGMLEPLGQSQVIAYLEQLADAAQFHLISYEKPVDRANQAKVAAVAERLRQAGIMWHPLTYHKAPTVPATLFDIGQGMVVALWLAVRHNVSMVHARSYIPALIGWIVKLLTGAKLLFDMRGLWADERTDGGLWPPGGRIYRIVKRLERTLLLGADHSVTLTHASKELIEDFAYLKDRLHAPLSVITTCADLDRFAPDPSSRPEVVTLGYLGSVGTWYMFDEVLKCFALIRARVPDARLLVVNRNEHEFIRSKIAEHGIDPAVCELVASEHRDVAGMISRMSVGAAIIKPVYSKIASAPTKLAEYLGCGIPCIGNVGVGDMEQILEGERVGVALAGFDDSSLASGVDRLLDLLKDPQLSARCRAVAEQQFSLEQGVAEYRRIYTSLLTTGWQSSPTVATSAELPISKAS